MRKVNNPNNALKDSYSFLYESNGAKNGPHLNLLGSNYVCVLKSSGRSFFIFKPSPKKLSPNPLELFSLYYIYLQAGKYK